MSGLLTNIYRLLILIRVSKIKRNCSKFIIISENAESIAYSDWGLSAAIFVKAKFLNTIRTGPASSDRRAFTS